MAKHAILGLTKTAAVEYAKDGVRGNAIAPGLVDTPLTARMWDLITGATLVMDGGLVVRG